MNKEESLALLVQGPKAWNAWAEKMLAERDRLQTTNLWEEAPERWIAAAKADFSGHTFEETANFSGLIFPGDASFYGTVFNGPTEFTQTVFEGGALFNDAHFRMTAWFARTKFDSGARFNTTTFFDAAEFNSATFTDAAHFDSATFKADARFQNATFSGLAEFRGATFSRIAEFNKATFGGIAEFNEATFSGTAEFDRADFSRVARFRAKIFSAEARFTNVNFKDEAQFVGTPFKGKAWFTGAKLKGFTRFDKTTFEDEAHFGRATFLDIAWFKAATFKGRTEFQQARFEDRTSFDRTQFNRLTSFLAIEVKSAFSLAGATFLVLPDFIQAHFAEAPRLDNSRIEPCDQKEVDSKAKKTPPPDAAPAGSPSGGLSIRGSLPDRFKGDSDRAARWRALKRLAIQGHDHARELEFFRGELLARRWSEDKPRHAVFWFGLLYQVLSDFGRSMLRPFLWWAVSIVCFTGGYLACHPAFDGKLADSDCVAGSGDAWIAALNLSLHKGLLVFGQLPLSKLNQTYACLYGIHIEGAQEPDQLPASFSPVIPDAVTALGFVQYPLSAVLIFLLLLAIRNHFRIK